MRCVARCAATLFCPEFLHGRASEFPNPLQAGCGLQGCIVETMVENGLQPKDCQKFPRKKFPMET